MDYHGDSFFCFFFLYWIGMWIVCAILDETDL